jgi:multiple sugar transport system permease protein
MTAPRFFQHFTLHVVLIMFAAIFLFPFVWMLLVASKTDEEVAAGKSFPALPAFRASSPYTTSSGATASLELLGVEVRTHDLRIFKVPHSALQIPYDFSKSNEPVEIRIPIELPVPFKDIHKLAIAVKPDDSWHRVEVEFVDHRDSWISTRPVYLAQHRPMTILYQPPSADDESLKSKTWVSLKQNVGAPSAKPDSPAELRIRILPSHTAQAVYGKLTRNYDRVFRSVPFWRYVGNSLLLVILSVAGMLFSSTFVAYAFARLNWPGRSIAMAILLSSMMLPPQVTMVPSFVVIKSLGWYNTLNPLWFPAWLGSAFFIFLMVQHLRTIPRELEEAARIDGLGYVQTWWYIILPQLKPAAAAIAILTFMSAWNDFLGPLIYLRDQSLFPLSLGLYDLQLQGFNDQSVIMAGNVLMTLPVVIIFFLFQRYFVAGVTMSGLKG